jgi:Mn2+/Fe2+ NRAMP family transporter
MSGSKSSKAVSSALLGSAFLMATSAIGPGFITQTTVFTERLKTSFGFVILCSIILDIVVQLNIWRILTVSGLRAQDLANKFLSGSGHVLTFLIVIGGIAFNIGNTAGAALGLQVMFGIDLWIGVIVSVMIALVIFWYREAGTAMDMFAKVMGVIMIVLTAYIAVISHPPVLQTAAHTFFPAVIDTTAIIVLVGGTVGGYISFAGAHRLIDAGVTGPGVVRAVSQTSVKGIFIAAAMRILLFLGVLGIVVSGVSLDPQNPAASVFSSAAGKTGYFLFGLVLWAASMTSVVGSAYTSVSFLRTILDVVNVHYNKTITAFVVLSAIVFLSVGKPISVLVIVGALNGFILPFALAIMLLAVRDRKIFPTYRHPLWLVISGWIVLVILAAMSVKTIATDLSLLWD